MKLSISLDTFSERILKLSSSRQCSIESLPLYSRWNSTYRRTDSAVAAVTHKISPNRRFQFLNCIIICFSATRSYFFKTHSYKLF